MQYGIRRSAHSDVEGHRVLEGLEGGDCTRQHRAVTLQVVALGQFDNPFRCRLEQPAPQRVRGQDSAVAGQRQTDRFVKAVHAVGREHP